MDGYLAGGHIVSRLAGLLLESTEDMFQDWNKLDLQKKEVCPRCLGGLVCPPFRNAVLQVAAVLGCVGLERLCLLRAGISFGSCRLWTCFPLSACNGLSRFVCCLFLRLRSFECHLCLRMARVANLFRGPLRGSSLVSASFAYAVGKASCLSSGLLLRLIRSGCIIGVASSS